MNARTVIISGASGLIGTHLQKSLENEGTVVRRLVRKSPLQEGEIFWNPGAQALDPALLEGADAVINLNGASIGRLPWTRSYRRQLWASRVGPTRTLAQAISQLGSAAPKLVSASAVGYYGTRPGQRLTETSAAGNTFLAKLCVAWEAAAVAAGPQARVALLRTAPILDSQATLKPLIPLTKMGLAGPLGSGRQIWPWISLPDQVAAIRHILEEDLLGPVNVTAPQVATQKDIGKQLAKQLRRPFALPVPAWALRAAVGAPAADSLLLADAWVEPDALRVSGFKYQFPTVEEAVAVALG